MDEADAVRAVVDAYLAAFNAGDVGAIAGLMVFPLAQVGRGTTTLVDAYAGNPARLRAATGWDRTEDIEVEVLAVSADKAHALLRRGRRVRADGSLIETVSAVYALTRTPAGWRIFAISAVVVPAG